VADDTSVVWSNLATSNDDGVAPLPRGPRSRRHPACWRWA
jgi:hypothetical protein